MNKQIEQPRDGRRKSAVVLVDDHPVVLQGVSHVLQREPDLKVVATARNSQEALSVLKANSPDLMIVDLSLGKTSGLDLVTQIRAENPVTKILLLSMHEEALFAEAALKAGASGYVMKDVPTKTLLTAIRQVLNGEIYLSARMVSRLLGRFVEGSSPETHFGVEKLTGRELEVFRAIGAGSSSRTIADEMGFSIRTVEAFRRKIRTKLNLKSGTELVNLATRWFQADRLG